MAGAAALREPAGLLFWWTSTAVLGLLTILNVCRRVYWLARGKAVEEVETVEGTIAPLSFPRKCWRSVWTGMETWLFLSAVPAPRFSWNYGKRDIPILEVFWSMAYAAGVFTLALYGTDWTLVTIANQSGWVAAAQIPLIIALSQKNNLISFLTGIRAERLAFLHRSAGRTCLVCAWIHVCGHVYLLHGFTLAMWQKSIYLWGAVGIMSYTLLLITSFRFVRNKLYEFFLLTHICLVAMTIAGFMMHWSAMRLWLYPGIGLWAGDRLLRVVRLVINNRFKSPKVAFDAHRIPSHASLSLLTPSTLKLTFPAPRLPWSAGQHFYVVVPGMSTFPWEAHPFTPCTVPESGELSFLVRVRDGFTGRMKQRLDRLSLQKGVDSRYLETRITAAVEGPYGVSRDLRRFDGVVLIAGGSGISFAIAHLLQIIEQRKGRVRRARVVWMVQSRSHVEWIKPMLQLHAIPETLDVQIHVHVTREPVGERADSWTTLTGPTVKRVKTEDGKWGVTWGEKRRTLQMQEHQVFRTRPVGILKKTSTSISPSEEDLTYTPTTRIGQHFLDLRSLSTETLDPSSQQSVPKRKVSFADQTNVVPPSMPRRPSGPLGLQELPTHTGKRKDPPQYYDTHEMDIPVLDFSAPPPLERQVSTKSEKSAVSLDSVYSEQSYDPAFVAGPHYTPPSHSLEKFAAHELDHLFHFHTGRADLKSVIEEARFEVGSGTLSVNVCGPGSLLRGAREAVREINSIKSAWRGEGMIDFHAETFGW